LVVLLKRDLRYASTRRWSLASDREPKVEFALRHQPFALSALQRATIILIDIARNCAKVFAKILS